MKKTRVLSIRLPVEALQSCFDLSEVMGSPTTVAGTAIARAISILTANLRSAGKLPVYSDEQLRMMTQSWAAKTNPSSMPCLELSSQADFDLLTVPSRDLLNIEQDREESQLETPLDLFDLNLDELTLEEEIQKQLREIELEDELDLLDKILISG